MGLESKTPAASGWWVYLLKCRDGSLYTGVTTDVAARLATHSAGAGARYTRSRLPVRLVYTEPAADRSAALRREAAIKRLSAVDKRLLVSKAANQGVIGASLRDK